MGENPGTNFSEPSERLVYMKIVKLPSGNYRAQVARKDENGNVMRDENGKRMMKSVTGKTKAEVERRACEILGTPYIPKLDPDITVFEAMEEYCNDRCNTLSPSTLYGYRKIREARLQSIMNIPISELTFNAVQRAVNNDYAKLSPKSVKEAVSHLKTVLKRNHIDLDLSDLSMKPVDDPDLVLPEFDDVLAAVLDTDIELACLLALRCSLRIGEVRGLQYNDIYIDENGNRCIAIKRVKLYINGVDVDKDTPKTPKSKRSVILPDWLYEKIIATPHKSGTDNIVPLGYKYIYNHFCKIVKENNLGALTFHGLRHEFATACHEWGITDNYIKSHGGWKTDHVMKRVYINKTKKGMKKSSDAIDEGFNKAMNKIVSGSEEEC